MGLFLIGDFFNWLIELIFKSLFSLVELTYSEVSRVIMDLQPTNFGQQIAQQKLRQAKKLKAEYTFDAAATRMYFSSFGEVVGRLFLLIGLLGVAVTLFFLATIVGKIATEAIPFSPVLKPLGQPLYEGITLTIVLLTFIWLFALLIMILLIKNIRALVIFGCWFLVIGLFFNSGLVAGTIFIYSNTNSTLSFVEAGVAGASLVVWLMGSIFIIGAARHRRRVLEKFYSQYIRNEG